MFFVFVSTFQETIIEIVMKISAFCSKQKEETEKKNIKQKIKNKKHERYQTNPK